MTNFNHFDKPVIHFGNVDDQKPEPPAAPVAGSILHFESQS